MTYEETKELEENVKIKKRADEIYNNLIDNIKLSIKDFDKGKFKIWSDSHNAKYIAIENGEMIYQCRFLHESYNIAINPSSIFKALKEKYRGVEHLELDSKKNM